jgi:ketosteroid isomerase-like protein
MLHSKLPAPISNFFEATRAHDARALLATFTPDALLIDMGEEYQGGTIADWNDRLFLGANVRVQPIHMAERDGKTVVTVMVDGDYANLGVTGPFQLDWWFTTRGDKIAVLKMVQERIPDVPPPVAAYIKGTNTFDIDACMAAFAEDAIVNDQRQEYRGHAAIREWIGREIIGDRVRMYVTQAMHHHDANVIVNASMDGDYDKTGLPDPLVLTFYFAIHNNLIAQLIILHNKAKPS